jgi:hypothetical protein
MLLVVKFDNLVEFAMLRSILALIALIIYTIFVMRIFAISKLYIIKLLLPIIISCVISSYLTQLFITEFPFNDLISFFLIPCVFFIIYLLCTGLLFSRYKSYNEIKHIETLIKITYQSLSDKLRSK